MVRMMKPRRIRVGGACGAYGARRGAYKGFGGRNLKETDHLEDQVVDQTTWKTK